MDSLKLIFRATPTEEETYQQAENRQKELIKQILPILIEQKEDFQFHDEREYGKYDYYTSFTLITKY